MTRRFQFSLRALLLVVLAVALAIKTVPRLRDAALFLLNPPSDSNGVPRPLQ